MTTISNEEFAKHMMLLAQPASEFKPMASYDADGDCIEFLAKPDPFYAERVDDLVTVYYSQKNGEVIGSLIKGVSKLRAMLEQRLPGFLVTIEDGPVRLEHLFLAGLWLRGAQPQTLQGIAYKKLAEIAERTSVEVPAEVCGVAA
jgi:hypothetical protein